MNANNNFLAELVRASSARQVLSTARQMRRYCTGIKVGGGPALAVVLPRTLRELWATLKVCVAHDKIIIVQAANTGLTGGSTPYGDDYDRDIVVINTLALDRLVLLNRGEQVLAFAGATLFSLEDKLAPLNRGPHSIIGSSCIGASIVGGVCNNSGGNLVNRGPAYTELALYAQLDGDGELVMRNHLGIDLGKTPDEILANLEDGNFNPDAVAPTDAAASDMEYQDRVRDVDADTPARYNADPRRLHEASGSAGKLAVFAVRLDTFPKPKRERVFYIGTNEPQALTRVRRHILSEFKTLPEMGEYMHASYFDASDKYCKDTFLFIRYFGSAFLPKLFAFKSWADGYLNKIPFFPDHLPDRLLQLFANAMPDHLPKRMREYRDRYEHYLMIKANDHVIDTTREYLTRAITDDMDAAFFECDEKEGAAAQLHRFVAGGAPSRYAILHRDKIGGVLPLDVSLPRNADHWYEILPQTIIDQLECSFRLSHFLCMVFHWDFVAKKGVDAEALKQEILDTLDAHGAKYPAEHNVGHLYYAAPELREFYQHLDPSNSFNPGIGQTSKLKHYA